MEAMKADELYIFTHPNFRPLVEMRFEAIRAGFDAADRSRALKAVKDWPPIAMPTVQRAQ